MPKDFPKSSSFKAIEVADKAPSTYNLTSAPGSVQPDNSNFVPATNSGISTTNSGGVTSGGKVSNE